MIDSVMNRELGGHDARLTSIENGVGGIWNELHLLREEMSSGSICVQCRSVKAQIKLQWAVLGAIAVAILGVAFR